MLIRDRLPAYITWERFEANQERLAANRNLPSTPGAPRQRARRCWPGWSGAGGAGGG